ncbi:MAG: AraC family transcriptional regulator [Streptococcaceae bacterium]|jgi:YesN/AraC family two-component response regulator|nr:AraC family transcriptional regulator [Streptococcaceae bacterium]
MLNKIVKEYLYNYNAKEIEQKRTGKLVSDYPSNAITENGNSKIFVKKFFLEQRNVFISKHNRFADYPEHQHEFLEFNYMLDGSCTQIINGESFGLTKGNLILLDKQTQHEIKALSENDILINIIFPTEKLDTGWLSELSTRNNMIFNFLLQDLSKNSSGEFLFFEGEKNENVQQILEQMINNYFTNSIFSNEILHFFIPILIMELIGNTPYHFSKETPNHKINTLMIKCLKLIEEESKTLTLTELADRLYYNKTYLSNLMKKKTGYTFTSLINKEKMKKALFLLESTMFSIQEVAQETGISNINYFYKIFEEQYKMTPGEFRKKLNKS